MRLLYFAAADAQGRHPIIYAVYDRNWFRFTHSANVPLDEKFIDEVGDNKELCLDLTRHMRRADADGDRKYYIDGADDIIEKEGWKVWIDPEDGTNPPTLPKPVYIKVSVAINTDRVRIEELSEKPTLTVAEQQEAVMLVLKQSAATTKELY